MSDDYISEKDNILINKNNFLTTLVWGGLLDRAKCGELARAIDLCVVEQEPCDDAISRQAAIEAFQMFRRYEANRTNAEWVDRIETVVKKLPSVKQKPKTGHWEWVQYNYNPQLGNWHCSECRCVVVECVSKEEKGGIPLYKYCPQCGAKMEVSE